MCERIAGSMVEKPWPQKKLLMRGKTFCIKQITLSQLKWLLDLHNDPEVLNNLTNPEPVSWENHERWFEDTLKSPREWRLTASVDGEPIGLAKIIAVDWQNKN